MRRILVAACALLLAGCTARADLKTALEVTDVTTGWYDAGVVDGKNKLVPSLTFRLRNKSATPIKTVSLNILFKYAGTAEEHDNIFLQRVDFNGDTTAPITVRSQTGHTGDPPQSRADMLKHSLFRDLDATILVREAAAQWHQLYKGPVARVLITE